MEKAPLLDEPTLDRAITLLGNGRGLDPLFKTLHAGEPIVMGVFGASVAQNAGCLDQPHKRCIWYSGKRNVSVGHGWPKKRPFKGFAVRFLDHINAKFPHKHHQINNSALDATPAQAALPCLFSHLPSRLHLVVLEFGSMATHLDLTAVEGVIRSLLSLDPPPALLLLSVQEWCTQRVTPRALYRVGQLLTGQSTRDNIYPDTPWSRAETETRRVCHAYGQACISVHRALEPLVYSNQTGFELHDIVGSDCLHPMNGRWGVDYVSQILTHWFDRAHESWTRIKAGAPRLLKQAPLPAPLHEVNRKQSSSRCYGFKSLLDSSAQALHPITWCSHEKTARMNGMAECLHGGRYEEHTCPSSIHRQGPKGAAAYNVFMDAPPKYWFYCRYTLSRAAAQKKISPGEFS